MTLYLLLLYAALVLCAAGILAKMVRWVVPRAGLRPISPPSGSQTKEPSRFVPASILLGAGRVIRTFVVDILFQGHLLLEGSPRRWAMHFCIFAGFTGLIVMHALEGFISEPFFPDYQPTLNPYRLLRNLFGALALGGLLIAWYRRIFLRDIRGTTTFEDVFTLGLLSVILVSGFAHEALKIMSPRSFDRMVAQYYPLRDQEDIEALGDFWGLHFGVVFTDREISDERIELGREVHELFCMYCHAPPASAFASYPLSRALRPMGRPLEASRADVVVWWVHVLSVFAALAWLPFGKLLHIVSTPLGMLLRSPDPAREAAAPCRVSGVKRAVGLDACVHCGICSRHCSVLPAYLAMGNPNILPSEKLGAMRRLLAARNPAGPDLEAFSEGGFICTECMRCTEVCPSRINLQDLWLVSKQFAADQGQPERYVQLRRSLSEADQLLETSDGPAWTPPVSSPRHPLLSDRSRTFQACLNCSVCTGVCPVVSALDIPDRDRDVSPHQLMNLVRQGMIREACASRMLWNCTTCYQCQEHCPDGIKVADILYELRDLAHRKGGERAEG